MNWSQLRKQLKDRIAPSLANSIDFHQTRYRHSHDQEGEFWITFGKEQIFNAASLSYLVRLGELAAANRASGAASGEAFRQAWPVVREQGFMLLEEVNKDLFGSLSQTVDAMLAHENPVVRALAIVDRRYGKRRLALFDPADEHPLVQQLFRLRCEAEGIAP